MSERFQFSLDPGKSATIRNTTSTAKVVQIAYPDGSKVRCVVIPGHGVEVTQGKGSPPEITLQDQDEADGLIGTPSE